MKICDGHCTGCKLCEQVCPMNAIIMKEDNDMEHIRPYVDSEKCVSCKKCVASCPQNNPVEKHQIKECYAAWNKDKKIRENSSSGGIASAIYEYQIDNNGWIVGVVMDNEFEAYYKVSNKKETIKEFRGSKYVQPNMKDIFKDVMELLKKREKVTFIGLPCHCAAMIKIAKKYRDNLTVVDLVCHGVPSQKVLRNHLEKMLTKNTNRLCFRHPEMGVVLALKNKDDYVVLKSLHEDEYMHAFITGNLFAESCYNCQYAEQKRISDITIGDFWGIGKHTPVKHKLAKPSLVLINTEKGEELWNNISKYCIYEERPIEEAIDGNLQLRMPSERGKEREELKKMHEEYDWATTLKLKYGKLVNSNYKKRKNKEIIKLILKKTGIYQVCKKMLKK